MNDPPQQAAPPALPIHDAVLAVDERHRLIFFGQGAVRLFGRDARDVIGHPIAGLFAPHVTSDLDTVLAALQRDPAAASVTIGNDPLVALTADGREVRLEGTLVKLVQGDPASPLLAVLRELAEPDERNQQLACPGGQALPDAPAQPLDPDLAALVRASSIPIWVKDRAGCYLAASRAYAELLGRPLDEVMGRSDAELLDEQVSRAMRAHDLAVLRAGTPAGHVATMELGGERRTLEVLRVPLYGVQGWPVALCGVASDALAARRTLLRNAQLAAIVTGTDDAMGSEDLDGVITSWNPAAERIYGYSEQEMVGRPVFDLIPPEDHADMRAALARVAAGETIQRNLARRLHKDGHSFLVALTLTPLRDEAGRVAGIAVISRDVTRLHEAEERARHLQGDLAAAREADRAKQAFFGAVSHELRSPLTAVIGWAELLQDEAAGTLTATQQGFLTKLLAAAQEQLNLLADIMDLARAGAGTFEVRPAPGDLGATARASVELLAPQAARAKVLLRADVPEAGPVLAFDRDRLGQVFRNLLGNALKFTPAGGHVTLRIRPAGASVRCEVQDTGPGIAPEEQARLFVPFTQLAAGRRHDGVGLGLAICKAIVEAHGGQIGLTSAPGRGSTFWFGLPAGCPPPEAHQAGHVVPTDVPGAPPAV